MTIKNILAERYATQEIKSLFEEEGKIKAERNLWIAVMKAQKELGLDIPKGAIERYEAARNNIDLELIKSIEMRTKHDVKARIDAYNQAAGVEGHIHKGMTSRDLTDNVDQMQYMQAGKIIFGKYVGILRHLMDKASEYDRVIVGRTHHQPAQLTLLGRRFSMWAEELHENLVDLERFIENYPLRGIKGAVGTQADMLTLLGNAEKVDALERKVAEGLGFNRVLASCGQVYPRSFDSSYLAKLSDTSAPCRSFALTMRLIAGYELVEEGFTEGQTGSSAMPHKMNPRSCERIYGFSNLLRMYKMGASQLSGDQWEEGDVSDSVGRRVIIPDAIYASDGLCETTLTVLSGMGAYPVMIDMEVERFLPYLASTRILMEAVQSGMGREEAHEVIKKYAIEEALRMREGHPSQLVEKLGNDPQFKEYGISVERIYRILQERRQFIGNAEEQISRVRKNVQPMLEKYASLARYEPRGIL